MLQRNIVQQCAITIYNLYRLKIIVDIGDRAGVNIKLYCTFALLFHPKPLNKNVCQAQKCL